MINDKEIPLVFKAKVFDFRKLENSGITVGRTRVFYKGFNRNDSFISEDFANQLINSALGVPIVGLWDEEKKDFSDHTEDPRKRAYGFIPENPNFSWEKHLDEDGIERDYACFDILLWTEKFPEANNILNASLSMELNSKTLSGAWNITEGKYYFLYTKGEMLGFCALGKGFEPCFEGAAFFEKAEVNFNLLDEIRESLKLYNLSKEGEQMEVKEKTEMEVDAKALETDLTPADDFYKETEKRQSETVTVHDGQDGEPATMVTETIDSVSTIEVQILEMQKTIEDLESTVAGLEAENNSLKEYKLGKEKEEKQAVVKDFSDVLSEEEIAEVSLDDYTVEELNDKFAALAYRKVASKATADFKLIQTDGKQAENTTDEIVKKYKKETK